MAQKKLYQTVITITLLHEVENEVTNMSLDEVIYEMNEGSFSGKISILENSKLLVGKIAANAIKEQGSGLEFFNMDDEGNEIEEDRDFFTLDDEGKIV